MEATSACASACASATSAHSLLLLQQLNVQREFGFLCDCTVAIGNVYFKAHRAVLAAFSNYFKMIFIHQTSECIKIQPTDIQPDVFSYLLHVMYTGACPKQAVEPARLEDGIKFLHAHQLCRKSGDGLAGSTGQDAAAPSAADAVRMSNLYGIQISSQLAGKDAPATAVHSGARGGRTHSHPSLAVGSEGERSDGQASSPQDDFDISAAIKQERPEDEGAEMGSPPQDGAASEERRRPPPPLACPRCGHCCPSPERLRQHLFSHALHPALFTEGLAHEGGGGLEDEDEVAGQRMDAGRLEEALRQSRTLAAQLAAELRRSREGAGLSAAPAAAHSRKRKMACAVCGVRFSHKSQLQEHMYAHTAKPPRLHRHSQLFHSSAHFCHEGGGALANDALLDVGRDAQDNGSSAYSLDSEISQESGDGGRCE